MTTRFTFTIPVALLNRYRAAAKAESMSVTCLIVRVLSGLQAAPKEKS